MEYQNVQQNNQSIPPNQGPPGSVGFDFNDSNKFKETYIDKKTTVYVIAFIFLFIGLVAFFQACGVAASGSDPSGLARSSAGSSNDENDSDSEPNPYALGLVELLGLLIVAISVGVIAYNMSTVSAADKLIKKGDLSGAVEVNGSKDKPNEKELLVYQTKKYEEATVQAGINPIALAPPAVIQSYTTTVQEQERQRIKMEMKKKMGKLAKSKKGKKGGKKARDEEEDDDDEDDDDDDDDDDEDDDDDDDDDDDE